MQLILDKLIKAGFTVTSLVSLVAAVWLILMLAGSRTNNGFVASLGSNTFMIPSAEPDTILPSENNYNITNNGVNKRRLYYLQRRVMCQ